MVSVVPESDFEDENHTQRSSLLSLKGEVSAEIVQCRLAYMECSLLSLLSFLGSKVT